MKTLIFVFGLATLAQAQILDLAALDDSPEPDTAPVGAGNDTSVVFDQGAAVKEAADSINSTAGIAHTSTVNKRTPCAPLPLGLAPTTSPDTPEDFLANPVYRMMAQTATTPTGWAPSFINLNSSNSANYYMGYTTMSSYNTTDCAAQCLRNVGCNSFNIYVERDAIVEPGDGCPDPSSTVPYKCVFWGGPVTKQNADNVGQYQDQFHVVMSASNGYNKAETSLWTNPPGYTQQYIGKLTINSPTSCGSYMTVKTFTDGPFSPDRCAAACTAQSAYNRRHPDSKGAYSTCQFYNTYMSMKNNVTGTQICALYTSSWNTTWAGSNVQTRDGNLYTQEFSIIGVNTTTDGRDLCATNFTRSPVSPS